MRAGRRRLQTVSREPKMEPWGNTLMKRQAGKEKPAEETDGTRRKQEENQKSDTKEISGEGSFNEKHVIKRVRRLKSPWDLAQKRPLRAIRGRWRDASSPA